MTDRVSSLLTPLTWLWRAGHSANFARAMRSQRALQTPVISVGALTMGGAGKSPMVAHLAARLREMGRNPAILTRGYKRLSREPIVIVRRGDGAPIESTGDEAQIFVRAGDAHVGIGADRYAVGRRMEQEIAPDIFLLDDGFQHVQLARSHDIVLIDAGDPQASGVFPVGRLREPLSALGRASEIVATQGSDPSRVKDLVRQYNSNAPVFRSRVIPIQWVDVASAEARPVACPIDGRVAAFCGLGSPPSFWRTLRDLKLDPTVERAFQDHHRYSPVEMMRLGTHAGSTGAEALLTTEKDAMNLPPNAAGFVAPLKLYWLKIGIEIEGEAELLSRIMEPA